MELLPAIDLYGGRAVRLYQGDYAQMTVYSDDPLSVAKDFAACGATSIHLVDLEGARTGEMPHLPLVRRIARETGLTVEVGGGVRSEESVQRLLDAGAERAILGTAAVTDPDLLARMVDKDDGHIAVSADIRDGMAAIRGWTQRSALTCEALMQRLQSVGVRTVVCTDISRDGAMRGANGALYRALAAAYPMHFIASGGVSSLEDVRALREAGLWGAIVGKAYYTGAIDLRRAIEVAR